MAKTIACKNAETVERFLDSLTSGDVEAAVELFTVDATVISPFAPPPLPAGIIGWRRSAPCFA